MAWAMRLGKACREVPSASRRLSRAARRASRSSCWACSSDMRSYMAFWVYRRQRGGRKKRLSETGRDRHTEKHPQPCRSAGPQGVVGE